MTTVFLDTETTGLAGGTGTRLPVHTVAHGDGGQSRLVVPVSAT